MLRLLLDTDTSIAIMNNYPVQVRRQLIRNSVDEVGISAISVYELQYGVSKSKKRKQNTRTLNNFLEYIQVMEWTRECAYTAGKLRAELEKTGNLIGPYDLLIAAHARTLKATLVTHNVKEFKRVGGLKIKDWVEGGQVPSQG